MRVRGDLPVTLAGIARVVGFYLFLAFIVFLAPAGPFFSYTTIGLASLLLILVSRSRPRPGNPLPGAVIGMLAITSTFVLVLASGGMSLAGLEAGVADALLAGLLLQAFVAVGEELSFRGYLFEDLRGQFGLPPALVISSIGFALLHLRSMLSLEIEPLSAAIALVNITAAGMLMALLSIRWGLLSAIGFHFTWNFFQYNVFGMGLGEAFDSVVRLAGSDNVLLTGGEFGPEASLPGLATIFVTLGIVWYLYRRQEMKIENTF